MSNTVYRRLCRVCVRKQRACGMVVTALTGYCDFYGGCDECHRGADSAMHKLHPLQEPPAKPALLFKIIKRS